MEGAVGGWGDMDRMPAPPMTGAFDVGMAFTEAELDFILFEGEQFQSHHNAAAALCPYSDALLSASELLDPKQHGGACKARSHHYSRRLALSASAMCAGGRRVPQPLHDMAYEAPTVRCIHRRRLPDRSSHASLQLLAQALPGLPFPASMVTSIQQGQPQFVTDFGHDAGLVGSGFGIDPASEQARARACSFRDDG